MPVPHPLRRLHPFEGLALTPEDLSDDQHYHRSALSRHALFLHGHGVVQGLTVTLGQRERRYEAHVTAGYGIAESGQGLHLPTDIVLPLEVPEADGEYVLWLRHLERRDDSSVRPVFDTGEQRPTRIVEEVTTDLRPAEDVPEHGVALARLNARLGRLVQVQLPVPRAGRQARAAESYLKPRVLEFIRLSRTATQDLYRTGTAREQTVGLLAFVSAMVSAEFQLVEEGTADRVLYRTAGTLVSYAHDFHASLPATIERVDQYAEFVRRVHEEAPSADSGDDAWLRWFLQFERLLQPLQRMHDELAQTAATMSR